MKAYQVRLPEDASLKDVIHFLNLMTVTMQTGAGDTVADNFVLENPHLVVEIEVVDEA